MKKGTRLKITHDTLGVFHAIYNVRHGDDTHSVFVQNRVKGKDVDYYPDDWMLINFDECKVEEL